MWNTIKEKISNTWKNFKYWIIFGVLGTGIALAAITGDSVTDFKITSVDKLSNPAFNILLDDITTRIETAQDDYFTQNGAYFQGMKTHSVIPFNGKSEFSDTSKTPQSRNTSFDSAGLGILLNKIPIQVIVNTYRTPKKELGYTIFYRINVDGKIYTKSVGYDAEDNSYDWLLTEKI